MKQRSTTPVSNISFTARACVVAAAVLTLVVAPFSTSRIALADQYDDQINALQQQINGYSKTAEDLHGQALTYQSQLDILTNEKNQIQAQLDQSVLKQQQLEAQIKDTQKKLKDNQDLLGSTIANLYVDENISPLEMLASSNNIADYVDKQANQNQVKDSVQQTINQINTLKKELEKQKKDVDNVVADQKGQRDALAQKEAEQQQLVTQTQGQEAAFQQLITSRNSDIANLRAQQVAANQRFFGVDGLKPGTGPACGGGYPSVWCNVPQDSTADNWGMYNRECVSYAAFKVAQSGHHMPYWGGAGNANQWPGNARAAGLRVDNDPNSSGGGVVAIWNVGPYGHAMYVESVNSNGTINVSQYNYSYDGTYSTMTISPNGLQFIHFQ